MAKTVKKAKSKKSASAAAQRSSPVSPRKKEGKASPSEKPDAETRRVVAEVVHHEDENDDSSVSPAPVEIPGENPELPTDDSGLEAPVSNEKALAPTDPVALYLSEIRKYPLLTREQESQLAKKYYETKDPVVAQALVTSNLRFVVKIAVEYSRFGARMIDLIQEGNMGLMHAVREFNPYKGVRLITYAVWWIRGYIQEYLMKQYSLVKIGTTQNQKKLFYQLQKQKEELDAMGLTPDVKLLSARMGIPEDEVQMMAQRMSGRDVSLDRAIDEESGTSLMDFQKTEGGSPDEQLSQREELSHLTEAIEELKPQLSERERIILDERILADEPMTLQEIGEKYGITREAVRQMEARLMKKIKEQFQKL